jgi:hypothetical protein
MVGIDAGLVVVIQAWSYLASAIRAGILAIVRGVADLWPLTQKFERFESTSPWDGEVVRRPSGSAELVGWSWLPAVFQVTITTTDTSMINVGRRFDAK